VFITHEELTNDLRLNEIKVGTPHSRCSENFCTYQPQAILVLDPYHVQAQVLAFEEGPFYFAVEVPRYFEGHWVRRRFLAHSEVEAENLVQLRVHQSAGRASEMEGAFQE